MLEKNLTVCLRGCLFCAMSTCVYMCVHFNGNILLSFSFQTLSLPPYLLLPLSCLSFSYANNLIRDLLASRQLNQSRASLTESAHTCPDRNDNDCGLSPSLCPVAKVISLFWNVLCGVRGYMLHSDAVWTQPDRKKEHFLKFHIWA